MPLLRGGELLLLVGAAALRHGAAHRLRRARLVVGEAGAGPRLLRPRHPPERGGDAAQEGRELRPRRRPGPLEAHDAVDAARGEDGRRRRVRDVPRGRRAAAAVSGQLLRRGGVRRVRAHRREGVRRADGGGGGREDARGGGAGEGDEARRSSSGVGPTARSGVRASVTGIEDGRCESLRACNRLHGQQPHRIIPEAQSARAWPRRSSLGLEIMLTWIFYFSY